MTRENEIEGKSVSKTIYNVVRVNSFLCRNGSYCCEDAGDDQSHLRRFVIRGNLYPGTLVLHVRVAVKVSLEYLGWRTIVH